MISSLGFSIFDQAASKKEFEENCSLGLAFSGIQLPVPVIFIFIM